MAVLEDADQRAVAGEERERVHHDRLQRQHAPSGTGPAGPGRSRSMISRARGNSAYIPSTTSTHLGRAAVDQHLPAARRRARARAGRRTSAFDSSPTRGHGCRPRTSVVSPARRCGRAPAHVAVRDARPGGVQQLVLLAAEARVERRRCYRRARRAGRAARCRGEVVERGEIRPGEDGVGACLTARSRPGPISPAPNCGAGLVALPRRRRRGQDRGVGRAEATCRNGSPSTSRNASVGTKTARGAPSPPSASRCQKPPALPRRRCRTHRQRVDARADDAEERRQQRQRRRARRRRRPARRRCRPSAGT